MFSQLRRLRSRLSRLLVAYVPLLRCQTAAPLSGSSRKTRNPWGGLAFKFVPGMTFSRSSSTRAAATGRCSVGGVESAVRPMPLSSTHWFLYSAPAFLNRWRLFWLGRSETPFNSRDANASIGQSFCALLIQASRRFGMRQLRLRGATFGSCRSALQRRDRCWGDHKWKRIEQDPGDSIIEIKGAFVGACGLFQLKDPEVRATGLWRTGGA
jgi:hypothetical protein